VSASDDYRDGLMIGREQGRQEGYAAAIADVVAWLRTQGTDVRRVEWIANEIESGAARDAAKGEEK
jgi:hypothetical protein